MWTRRRSSTARRCSDVAAASLLLALAAIPVLAQPPGRPEQGGYAERRRELKELNRRLAEMRARYEATRRKAADLKDALAAAELNLEIRIQERRVAELSYEEVERAASKALLDRDVSAQEVKLLQQDLTLRLGALYRMGRLGYLRTLVVAESGRTFLRGLQVLTHLVKRDAALLTQYETSLATLKTREVELAGKRQELLTVAEETRRKETEMQAARAEKAALLARVERVEVQEKTEVSRLSDRSERLTSLLDLLETHGRVLPPGTASIRKFKGVLDWPARGKVAVPFGRIANPKFPTTFLRSTGWTIDVPAGTQVHAVYAGDVAFSQWLKGYGNLVVLDHGDGVFTLYGRLNPGPAQRGARIGVGDPVGTLGFAPEDEVPGLYFEIRESRTSVDPRLWLK